MKNNKEIIDFKPEIKSIDINFNDENVEIYFNSIERKFLKISYYQYRVFKQIDGIRKIKDFKKVDKKTIYSFLEILKKNELIFSKKQKKLKEIDVFKEKKEFNDRFLKIIKNNFKNKKFLIIGCNNQAAEVAIELTKLNVSKFILWDCQELDKVEKNLDEDSLKYWNKSLEADIAWRIERIKKNILKYNPNAQIELIPSNITTYDLINHKNLLSSEIDFGFVFSEINDSLEYITYDLLNEFKIPYTIISNFSNTVEFGPIVNKKCDEAKNFIGKLTELKNLYDKKGKILNFNLKNSKFVSKNLIHEIILFFLDREECQILFNKVSINIGNETFKVNNVLTDNKVFKNKNLNDLNDLNDEKSKKDQDLIENILSDPEKIKKIKAALENLETLKTGKNKKISNKKIKERYEK